MEKRIIPIKNYIILGFVVVATMLLLFYLVSSYQKRKAYESSMNTRMNFLSEVKESELQNYILDNHDAIIYISDSTDDSYRVFENQLKKLILEYNLTKDIVYMDSYKISYDFLENLQKQFHSNVSLNELTYPNVLVVSDGILTSVLYTSEQEKHPADLVQFIQEHLENE